MAETMVERVARAIAANGFDYYDPDEIITHKPPPSEFQSAEALGSDDSRDEYWLEPTPAHDETIWAWKGWRQYVDQARIVIAAMREPTPEIIEAYVTGNDQLYRDPAITALRGTAKAKAKARFRWTAAIDAALAPTLQDEERG